MKLKDINMRDPYILRDDRTKMYYLYGTTNIYDGRGFYAYRSKDLENWEGKYQVFMPLSDFWGTKDYWAPEVHFYRGRYYMIATFKGEDHHRCCQILSGDHPLGPFVVHSDIVTPEDWESLDGTLYIENDTPYLIFVHEWTQIGDGEVCSVELSPDLTFSCGEPKTLFKASEAPWSSKPEWTERDIRVADGPFIVNEGGKPFILWSSYLEKTYDIGFSYPKKGVLDGPYAHSEEPLPLKDAGHGMIFSDFHDQRYLVLHADNGIAGKEHPILVPVKIGEYSIEIEGGIK